MPFLRGRKLIPGLRKKHLYIALAFVLFSFIAMAQGPTANFKSDITSGCSPIVVNFQDQSTGNPTSWFWDFGNGATSTLRNPAATYFSLGTYTVTLVVSDSSRKDTITKVAYITVIDPPKVNFSVDKTAGCSPSTIHFTDQSTAAPGTSNTQWLWDFGDGTSSTLQSPTKQYSTPESYTVSLKVTNNKGCSKTFVKANYINIAEGAVADFSNPQPSVCSAPASITFSNKATGPGTLSYVWNFGDGATSTQANPTHSYTANGSYTVSLITTSSLGCSDTIQKTQAVKVGGYTTDFTSKLCQAAPGQFTNSSTPNPSTSLWTFSDGTTSTDINPTKTFANSGPVTVKLVNDYGSCKDSVTKTVTVSGKPTVDFTTKDTVKCQPPATVNFTNTSNAATYQWSFGDGGTSTQNAPSYTYNKLGTYSVTLVATTTDGCVDSLTKNDLIKVQKAVISLPGFPQQGCIPYTTTFKPTIVSLDKVLTYQWNFGDGGSSTETNPTYTYTKRGTYDVTLTITTSTGCTETYSLKEAIKVGPKPVANFSADQTDICASDKVKFTDLSTPADEIKEWLWTFSDGSSSSQQNPSQQFKDTGMITVQLVAYNNGCPSSPAVKTNYIHVRPPIAQFTFQPNCTKRNEISFTNTSIVDPKLPTSWEWNFGDGTPVDTRKDPSPHTYPTTIRSWDVSLKVTNGSCSYTIKKTVSIDNPALDITASSAVGCKPFSPTLKAVSGVQIVSSVWDFGDASSQNVTGASASHTYPQSGNYTVQTTITDKYGCKYSTTKNQFIKVYGPEADFVSTTNKGCVGMTTTFEDKTVTDGQHAIVNWQWDFGDGKTQSFTSGPFQHKYDSAGLLNVALIVKDAYGCTDTVRKDAFVTTSALKAKWDASTKTCPGAALQFKNDSPGQFTSIWEFGDGTTSTDKAPTHIYADTGFYTVKLKIQDDIGCQDSLVKTNYIQVGKPLASFTANNFTSFCTPFKASFTNTSSYYVDHFWDLAVATSRQENPSVYYLDPGTYDIKLTVTSPGGCKDVKTQQIKVFNPSDAKITYGPDLDGCRPLKISFEAFADMKANFVWDFGDGNVIDTTANKIEHVYTDPGNFIPRIIMTEPNGSCKIPLVGKETIRVFGAKAKFSINTNLFCDSGYLRITDSTVFNDQIVSYNWNFGDGTSSTNPKDTLHFYANPGNYDVFLKVTTANGCVDSMRSKPIKVVQSPLISIQSDSVVCANERMRHAGVFLRSDTSAVQWQWQFPNGNGAATQYPANQLYSKPGSYVVTAIATNSSGCADTAYQSIRVDSIPVITMPSSITTQQGFPITIPATYSPNVTNYTWVPAATLSCADCPQPIASPKFNTKYTVSVVDDHNCKNSSDVQVIVLCKNANVFVPNTFSPNGDGSNDVFYVRGKGLDRVKSLRIFNRWGEIVFEKRDFPVNDASVGWDGKYKGNRPQADVYVYQVEVFCENSEIIRFEGNVALIQ